MKFVIDTNIVFSALIKEGKTRELIMEVPLTLYAPETLITDTKKYEDLIIEKSGLTREEFEALFELITENITIVKKENYEESMYEAEKIIGHIDRDDIPFLALALSIENDGIWSDDRHFQMQDKIKVWKTEEVVKSFSGLNQ